MFLHRTRIRLLFYFIGGGSGTLLDFTIFIVLFNVFLSYKLPVFMLNIFCYLCGTLLSYSINKFTTFSSETHYLDLRRYFAVAISGLTVSTIVLLVLLAAGLSPVLSKCFSIVTAVILQFTLNSSFSMKSKE